MLIPISTTINQSVSFGCNLGSALTELEVRISVPLLSTF